MQVHGHLRHGLHFFHVRDVAVGQDAEKHALPLVMTRLVPQRQLGPPPGGQLRELVIPLVYLLSRPFLDRIKALPLIIPAESEDSLELERLPTVVDLDDIRQVETCADRDRPLRFRRTEEPHLGGAGRGDQAQEHSCHDEDSNSVSLRRHVPGTPVTCDSRVSAFDIAFEWPCIESGVS